MSRSVSRPPRPVALTAETTEVFPLQVLAQELMAEETFRKSGRNALTLTHQPSLTVVLIVLGEQTVLQEHKAPGPVILVPLSGRMEFSKGAGVDPVALEPGTSVAFGAHLVHRVEAHEDSALLVVIGEQQSK